MKWPASVVKIRLNFIKTEERGFRLAAYLVSRGRPNCEDFQKGVGQLSNFYLGLEVTTRLVIILVCVSLGSNFAAHLCDWCLGDLNVEILLHCFDGNSIIYIVYLCCRRGAFK